MNLFDKKHIFLVGIKGVAMANIAVILQEKGIQVSGADVDDEFHTDEILKKHHISVASGFAISVLPTDVDLVMYSAAHGGLANPLVTEAHRRGIATVSQAGFLGELIESFPKSIAVAGCHGKTTTSSLLAYALTQLGEKPSYLVGAASFSQMPAAQFHQSPYFVIEADEYGVNPPQDKTPKFHFLKPQFAIITNIDFDHPDVFKDLQETRTAFSHFISTMLALHADAFLAVCADDEPLMEVMKQFPRQQYLTFGFSEKADVRVADVVSHNEQLSFTLVQGQEQTALTTQLTGNQNISNIAGVFALLRQLGFPAEKIAASLTSFSGVKRRFEIVHHDEKKDIYIVDDYAHHPKEIEAVIRAARMRFPGRKIIVFFQPHTVSRTKAMAGAFMKALSHADQAYVLPVFESAREAELSGTFTADDLMADVSADDSGQIELFTPEKKDEQLHNFAPTDVIITMGAGDVYKLKNDIMKAL